MDVYIEYVVLDNFTITFLIAALTYKIMLKRVAKLRSVIAATVGTGVAVAYPFVYSDVLVLLVKLGLWLPKSGIQTNLLALRNIRRRIQSNLFRTSHRRTRK